MTVSHLVRRGVEAFSAAEDGDMPIYRVEVGSPILAGLFFITILAGVFAIFSVSTVLAWLLDDITDKSYSRSRTLMEH